MIYLFCGHKAKVDQLLKGLWSSQDIFMSIDNGTLTGTNQCLDKTQVKIIKETYFKNVSCVYESFSLF